MTLWGLRSLGALPIDIDARAGTDLFTKFIGLTRPSYMACTPSLAEYLVRKNPELLGYEVGHFKFKGVLTTGEVGIAIPEIKKKLESAYGCRFYDYWALAETRRGFPVIRKNIMVCTPLPRMSAPLSTTWWTR